jgi:hypothetical protein
MSLIDIGTTAYIANETTQALFKTNAWNWLTDGWLGRSPSASTDSSYELSLYELMTGALGMNAYPSNTNAAFGVNIASATAAGMTPSGYALNQIKINAKANGGKLFGTIIVAPIAAKMAKKVISKPLINPTNRKFKRLGVSSATGVKL